MKIINSINNMNMKNNKNKCNNEITVCIYIKYKCIFCIYLCICIR